MGLYLFVTEKLILFYPFIMILLILIFFNSKRKTRIILCAFSFLWGWFWWIGEYAIRDWGGILYGIYDRVAFLWFITQAVIIFYQYKLSQKDSRRESE